MTDSINRSARILVVDDEPGIRELLSSELIHQGYQVRTAVDGFDALQRLDNEKFQVVISDVRMPKMDGMEMLHVLRQRGEGLEIILMTAYATAEMAAAAMKQGAFDFVRKPFAMSELLTLVEKSLAAAPSDPEGPSFI